MTRRANRLAEKPAARGLRRWAFVALATLAATTASCARVESEGATPTTQTAPQTTAKMTSTLADADAVAPTIDASGKWKVLAVGINKYADNRAKPLLYSEKDARDVADAFIKLGASEDDVLVVDFPNKRNIERACADFFSSLQRGDRAVVFFSGHGIQFDAASGGVESFFVPNDCVLEDKEKARETAVSIDRVLAQFNDSRASFKWMIVDACRYDPSKATPLYGASKGLNLTSAPDSIVLLQSCKAGYVSYEGRGEINGKPLQNSLFTLSLLEALDPDASPADADGNGTVSFTELFAYVVQTTDERAKRQEEGRPQRPYLLGNATDFTLFDGLGRSNAVKAKELFVEAKKLADEKKYAEAREIMKDVEALEPNNPVYASYAALLDELEKQANATSPSANDAIAVDISHEQPIVIPKNALDWKTTDDGVVITGVNNMNAVLGAVSIPQTIGGKRVVEIGELAFENCSITNLIIPEGIKRVGENAFFGCASLQTVLISASVANIGSYAFDYASSLEEINVDPANARYESHEGVLFSKNKETLILYPSAKNDVDKYAVPSSVKRIEPLAFRDCRFLTSLSIPASVELIDYRALLFHPNVERIDVDPKNKNYASKNGVLYSKDMRVLVRCPNLSGEFIVPREVEALEGNAFNQCRRMTKIKLHDSVFFIGSYAFEQCVALENVALPKSLSYIANDSFYNYPGRLTVVKDSYAHNWAKENFSKFTAIESDVVAKNVLPESALVWREPDDKEKRDSTDLTSAIVRCVSNTNAIKGDCALPVSVGGKRIIGLESNAFRNCSGLETLNIPEGVETLGENVFYGCNSLQTLNLPSTIKALHKDFSGSKSLKNVAVSKNGYFVVENGVLYSKDKSILALYPPGKSVNQNFTVPEGVQRISRGAFGYCKFNELYLPKSVDIVDAGTFYNTTVAQSISVAPSNDQYASINGALFTKDHKTLIRCPILKEDFAVPQGVEKIESHAFDSCDKLRNVSFPNGLKTIEFRAFKNCRSLGSITIPESVASITNDAFDKNLKLIVRKGCYAEKRLKELGYTNIETI